ncbi:RHS repeat domain-containing protein [Chryseobacterium oranimense]|uniref:RHS repeat domain-containing protein n=1 Tax=Chryseobacterium oranimense TaxID=421058 RepID=UPI003CD0BDA2
MGNVRLSYTQNGSGTEIIEENNFYSFGMKHEGYNALAGNPSYNYGYNGKELQKETGWSDYGARMYMAEIGRWGVIDPLAETTRRISPYNYAMNNPVMFIDPDGRKAYVPMEMSVGVPVGGGYSRNSYLNSGTSLASLEGGIPTIFTPDAGGASPNYLLDDLRNAWVARGIYSSISPNGYLTWWTGGAAGNANTSQEMIAHMLKLNSYEYDSEMHKISQDIRKWSGYAFSANKFVFQPAADRAVLYGAGEAYSTTNLVFEKALPKILSSRRIYVPLMEVSVKNAQRLAAGTKYAGRILGGAGILLAGGDILSNGANMSNSLDLVMSVLAVSPTGWGQAIAGTYFLANGITTLVTGKDIGQHIEGAVNKYYNDGVRAEEQRKFNAAMGY